MNGENKSAPENFFFKLDDRADRRSFRIQLPGPADSRPLFAALERMESNARPALDIRSALKRPKS